MMNKMKNKAKIFTCSILLLLFLMFFAIFIMQKTLEFVNYGELITMDVIQSVGHKKSEPLIESKIDFNIEKIKQGTKVKNIFKGIKDYDAIWYIITFDSQKAICLNRKLFKQSKNKKIQEYLKNECNK